MVVKKIICIFLVFILSLSSLQGSWKSWADNKIQTYSQGSYSVRTQTTRSFGLGRVKVRWGSLGTVYPVHIDPPSFDVGCNGIDINFGSISFLEFDILVDKLKQIASAAPAFAFKMAINTVCSQCATIMQDLETIIDGINNLNLDACSAAQSLGNFAGKSLGDGINNLVSSGAANDHAEAEKEKNDNQPSFMAKAWTSAKTLASSAGSKASKLLTTRKGYGSLLENAFFESTMTNGLTKEEIVPFLRAVLGDVIGRIDSKGAHSIERLRAEMSVTSFINSVVLEGGQFKAVKLIIKDENGNDFNFNSGNRVKNITTNYDDININDNQTWSKKISIKLDNIITKLINNQEIVAADQSFIASLPIVLLPVLNAIASGEKKFKTEDIGNYIALENARYALKLTMDMGKKNLTSLLNSIPNKDTEKEVNEKYSFYIENLKQKMRDVDSVVTKKHETLGLKKLLEYMENARKNNRKRGLSY